MKANNKYNNSPKQTWVLIISVFIASFCHGQNTQTHVLSSTLTSSISNNQHSVNPNTLSQTASNHKKKLKRRSTLSRTIRARLKKLITVLWGSHGWQENYLRRFITLGATAVGGSLVKDTLYSHTDRSKPPRSKKQHSPIENVDLLAKADRVQNAYAAAEKRKLQFLQQSQQLDIEYQKRISELEGYAINAQQIRDQLKAERNALPVQFMQALFDNNTEHAVNLLADQQNQDQEEKHFLRHLLVNHNFVQAIYQILTRLELGQAFVAEPEQAWSLLNEHIKSIITKVLQDPATQEASTYAIAIELFKIAIKLNSTTMASELLDDSYKINDNLELLFHQAIDYESLDILRILEKKYHHDYVDITSSLQPGIPYEQSLSRTNDTYDNRVRRTEALLYVSRKKSTIELKTYPKLWQYAVIYNDHEIMHLLLNELNNAKNFNLHISYGCLYMPILKSKNLYAMDLFIKKMQELSKDLNEKNKYTLDHTLLDTYLHTIGEEQDHPCPLMVRLLVNAGFQLKETSESEPALGGKLSSVAVCCEKHTYLERFTGYTCKEAARFTDHRKHVLQLLLAERNKVNISDIAALCSASVLEFTDHVRDIIFYAQHPIHPRLLGALYVLSNAGVGESIKAVHGERIERLQLHGHNLPENGTAEDNRILSRLLKIPKESINIIQQYMGIATQNYQRPLVDGHDKIASQEED